MGTIVDAIDRVLFEEQDQELRSHTGASTIGEECGRKIWYSFRWVLQQKHRPQLLRLFERGHLEEDRFVGWLRKAGVIVHQNDPATGRQYRFTGYKGHYAGEIDAVGEGLIPGPYLLEFKTHNDKSFKDLCANKVKMAKPTHYVQMQMYMGQYKLPRAVYLAINKNTDDLYDEVVEFNQAVYDKYLARAATIIDSPEPPPRISNNASWFECKWCDFHAVCHLKAEVLKNCRTCAHSTPVEQGQWLCENDSREVPFLSGIIPIAIVKAGCSEYHRHPME